MEAEKQLRVFCSQCGGSTRHRLCSEYRKESIHIEKTIEGEPLEFEQADVWQILECCGCERVQARKWWEHEVYEEEWGAGESCAVYFPPPMARKMPVWLQPNPFAGSCPVDVSELAYEVYHTLHSDCPRLALIGMRSIVDFVLNEVVGDCGGFAEKLDALEAKKFIGGKNRIFLESAIDAGSAAAHRGAKLDSSTLNAVMDIIENLLQAIYVLPEHGTRIKSRTPPRPPRRKS